MIATALPIDDALKKAMPANVRKVVNQFNPSGLVNARASVSRKPMNGPGARPEGRVRDRRGCRFDRAPVRSPGKACRSRFAT